MCQADDFAAAPPLKGHFKFQHKVFGLVLDFKVAVAQHAELKMRFEFIARKQRWYLE